MACLNMGAVHRRRVWVLLVEPNPTTRVPTMANTAVSAAIVATRRRRHRRLSSWRALSSTPRKVSSGGSHNLTERGPPVQEDVPAIRPGPDGSGGVAVWGSRSTAGVPDSHGGTSVPRLRGRQESRRMIRQGRGTTPCSIIAAEARTTGWCSWRPLPGRRRYGPTREPAVPHRPPTGQACQ